MEPKSFSATAMQTFEMCPARYRAEAVERVKGIAGVAASTGSACHNALEMFVEAVHINKTEADSLDLLMQFYKIAYSQVFHSFDYDTEEFLDGQEMLKNWHKRTDFTGVKVLSVEVKTNFEVPTPIGPIPFNYIWDRFDQIGERTFKVVDYKTNRWGLQPSDLKKKIQARAYGLAAAIQLKREGIEWDRIWVEFDLLRHQPVGISFSHEDNAAMWKYLKETAKQIVETPDDEVEERLNDQCLFCVRKASCGALKKNIMVGGVHSLGTIEDAIDLRAQLEWQRKGLDALLREVDQKILAEARERDLEEYESDLVKLTIGVSRRRAVDAEMVQLAIGDALFNKYGSSSITMASVDKLLKGRELTDDQKKKLRGLIYTATGNPSVKIEAKNPIDDD